MKPVSGKEPAKVLERHGWAGFGGYPELQIPRSGL